MGYANLRECVADLERAKQLVRIEEEVDPDLEAAEIQRRVFQAGGPAVYYARVRGCAFPMLSNLFGTLERTRFLFRDTLAAVRHLVELKVDPGDFDLVELNEAFAAQAASCVAEMKLDPERVNPSGGAIAMGHPIGASGARLLTHLAHRLARGAGRTALATLCVGGGMGHAVALEAANER